MRTRFIPSFYFSFAHPKEKDATKTNERRQSGSRLSTKLIHGLSSSIRSFRERQPHHTLVQEFMR
jgi:hypothetical protein